jgi:hypothetical protein
MATNLEKELLSLPETELQELLAKVQNKRKRKSKKKLLKVPKAEMDNLLKRAQKFFDGEEVRRNEQLKLVFNVYDHLVWESEDKVHYAGIHLEFDSMKSKLPNPHWFSEDNTTEFLQNSLLECLQDYEDIAPRTQKKIEELNKRVKTLLIDIEKKEKRLGLSPGTIWDEIEKRT